MKKNRIEALAAGWQDNLSAAQLTTIEDKLESIDDSNFTEFQKVSLKSPMTTVICAVLFGWMALDHFVLGQTKTGLLKLFTGGGFCVWMVIDWFTASKRTKEYNFKKLQNLLLQKSI